MSDDYPKKLKSNLAKLMEMPAPPLKRGPSEEDAHIAALEQRVRELEDEQSRTELRLGNQLAAEVLTRRAAEREAAALREERDVLQQSANLLERSLVEAEAERDALRLRVAECEGALKAIRRRNDHPGRYDSEIEELSHKALYAQGPSPVSALIEAGRLGVRMTRAAIEAEKADVTKEQIDELYRLRADFRKACAAIIAKEKSDPLEPLKRIEKALRKPTPEREG